MGTYREQNTSDRVDFTPGSAVSGGTPTRIGGSILGTPDRDVAASQQDGFQLAGIRRADSASATVFAKGDTVYYNLTTGLAVVAALTFDPDVTVAVGVATKAKASGELFVQYLPSSPTDRYGAIQPYIYEFDCDGANGDVLEHVLIPAWMNRHGLLILGVFGIVTEVFAGSSEDQGIITIEDEDDNAISTLTASNAAADAVNDVIVGTNDLYSATSGDAAKVVAAGKAVQGFVSQQTSGGTPAGKMKVYIRAIPLL